MASWDVTEEPLETGTPFPLEVSEEDLSRIRGLLSRLGPSDTSLGVWTEDQELSWVPDRLVLLVIFVGCGIFLVVMIAVCYR